MRRTTVMAVAWPAAAAVVGGTVWLSVYPAFVADAGGDPGRPLPPARSAAPSPSAYTLAQVRHREPSPTPSPTPKHSPTSVIRSDGADTVVRVVYTDGGSVTLSYSKDRVDMTGVEPIDEYVEVVVDRKSPTRIVVRLQSPGHVSTVEAFWERPGVSKANVHEDDEEW
ncbi:hypothetical protein Lfu02_60800 [Longispora fulva]|uniref:Uncharacterized protein n=1 Tax=Longispora fulva TaxID=619741 RepID=A0A8J7KJJ1_9ACTN|nr:hypothetical protein [Longispora fulva]MBG6136939.1 hypothetical protein [Longispora fulva]GIG61708.1 hypothetical protein Lfu02_60800 [Longispora fulva]